MRSKLSWWTAVVLLAVLYGMASLTATFVEAFGKIFESHDRIQILWTCGGWISVASGGGVIISMLLGIISSAFSSRISATCVDLARLNAAAFCGALATHALGSDEPWIFAPVVVCGGIFLSVADRRINALDRPWQTWALASLAVLVAAPLLFISRL